MQKTATIAYKYLKSKHQTVKKLSNGDFVCDGEYYYSPRLVRGGTIWLSSRRYEHLINKKAIILAVTENGVTEIPISEIKPDCEVHGIRVKIVDDYVRIRIPRDLKKRLDEISKDPVEAISCLLGLHDRVSVTPKVGYTNEALAFRACLKIAKHNMCDHIRVMNKAISKKECKLDEFDDNEKQIIRDLVASRVLYIDHRADGDYVIPLCSFKLVEEPDKVSFTMMFFREFCRKFCYNYDTCSLVKESNSNVFGFTVTYTHDEFRQKTVEELVAKWIGMCLE